MEDKHATVEVIRELPPPEPPTSQGIHMEEEESQWIEDIQTSANNDLNEVTIRKIATLEGDKYSPFFCVYRQMKKDNNTFSIQNELQYTTRNIHKFIGWQSQYQKCPTNISMTLIAPSIKQR